VSSKASLYSDLKERKMNRSLIGAGVVCAMAIALLILAPVLAQEESGTSGKQSKKKDSEERLVRVHTQDKQGEKTLELTANRDEALSIIFAAYESISSLRFRSNLLKPLVNDYKGTKYEERIMAFLKGHFLDNPSSMQRAELLVTGLCVNSKHPVTRLMLAQAAETEGEDKADKALREVAHLIRKDFHSGDKELLDRLHLTAEMLRPPEDSNCSQKQKKGGK
jgi:hypothetical protein